MNVKKQLVFVYFLTVFNLLMFYHYFFIDKNDIWIGILNLISFILGVFSIMKLYDEVKKSEI